MPSQPIKKSPVVLKQAHIPVLPPSYHPQPHLRPRPEVLARAQVGRKRWQRIARHPCEPQVVSSMSIGSVCMLHYAHRPYSIELRYEL